MKLNFDLNQVNQSEVNTLTFSFFLPYLHRIEQAIHVIVQLLETVLSNTIILYFAYKTI